MDEAMSTEGLVRRTLAGDDTAYTTLVSRYETRLALLVRRIGGRALGADFSEEDAVQTALHDAYARLASFTRREHGSFYRWLVAFARNTINNRLHYLDAKGRGEVVQFETGFSSASRGLGPAESRTGVGTLASRREEIERLNRALAGLPEDLRQPIELYYLHGRSFAEIGDTLELSKSTAFERLKAGISRLKEALT